MATAASANAEPSRLRISAWFWYGFVVVASITLSLGGFFYGACHTPSADGGRGGALAVVVAFFALFVKTDHARKAFKTYVQDLPEIWADVAAALRVLEDQSDSVAEPKVVQDLRSKVNGTLALINALSRDQFWQNACVAFASSIGTLSWCFGDKAADSIRAHHWGWLKILCQWMS